MQEKLEAIFKQAFGIDRLTDDLSIENVDGWDSMAHVALILALQKEFGVEISPADALELTDVASIKRFLSAKTE
jgi:acyl carrier protein